MKGGRICDGYSLDNIIRHSTAEKYANEVRQVRFPGLVESPSPLAEQVEKPLSYTLSSTQMKERSPSNFAALCSPTLLYAGDSYEQHILTTFNRYIAPNLGGYLDLDFWSVSLPRIATSELPVLHAVLAITATEHPSILQFQPSALKGQDVSTLFYNRAINSIMTGLENGQTSRHIVLLTCFLFICFEFKRGNIEAAMCHLQSGLGILCSRELPSNHASELSDITDKLSQAFTRLSIQGSLVGQQPPSGFYRNLKDSSSPVCNEFSNLINARESLVSLFVQSLDPGCYDENQSICTSSLSAERSRREEFISQLQQWDSKLGRFLMDRLPGLNPHDIRAIYLMRIQSLVATIWNSTCMPADDGIPEECSYDAHTAKFNKILSLAAHCVEENDTASSSASTPSTSDSRATSHRFSSFSIEMGVIFGLYFTATKCRSPSTRRRAANLFSQVSPQREGMWDAKVLRPIVEYAITFEESSCTSPVTEDMESWPMEAQRIHGIYLLPQSDSMMKTQKVRILCNPMRRHDTWRDWVEDVHL